jgi:hypothetical protein
VGGLAWWSLGLQSAGAWHRRLAPLTWAQGARACTARMVCSLRITLGLIEALPRQPRASRRRCAKAARARSVHDRLADAITAFAGRMVWVYVSIVWCGVWRVLNTGRVGVRPCDEATMRHPGASIARADRSHCPAVRIRVARAHSRCAPQRLSHHAHDPAGPSDLASTPLLQRAPLWSLLLAHPERGSVSPRWSAQDNW